MKKCCVVIITHKERLDGDEEISFKQALSVFSGRRDIKVVLPDNISYDYYNEFGKTYDFEIVKINNQWLKDYKAYNKTLCRNYFYDIFNDYEYILIYQVDAWVYYDNLDYFMELDFDYYGAPWPYADAVNNPVGNGGFSLRKVDKMLEVCGDDSNKNGINEDVWFCKYNKDKLNICTVQIASNFSLETITTQYLQYISTIPMGLHGKNLLKYRKVSELLKEKKMLL